MSHFSKAMKMLLILALVLFGSYAMFAQTIPPPQLMYTLVDGVPTPASGSGQTLPFTPPSFLCYGLNGSGQPAPCDFSGGGGGGATLPFPGIVFATSGVGGRVAVGSDIATLITTATGCSTAGFVWVPASNTCVANGSGGVTFGTLPGGTNTGQGLVVGAGSVLTPSGGGFINANEANGALFPVSAGFAGTNSLGQVVPAFGTIPSSKVPVNIANGLMWLGNSIIAGTGPSITSLTYQNRFDALYPVGPAPVNRALAGTVTSDVINFGALQLGAGGATPSTGTLKTSSQNSQLFIIQSLENDANFSGAANANQKTYTQTVDMALLALTTAPLDQWNQVTGNLWTCTGGAAPTDNYYGSIPPDVLLTTGQSCSTTITTAAVPGSTVSEPIDLLYVIFASDTGSGNMVVDGTACTDTITGSSTLANTPFGGATFLVTQSYTRTLALARCVPATTGSHSVTINSIAGGTNGFGFQAIFTTPVNLNNFTAPTAVKVGVMRQLADANSANTAAYNTLSINDCNQMLADGFRCINAPAREPFITTSNLAFMMSGTSAFTAGAIVKTGMSWTAGNATLTIPSGGMDASYNFKTVICLDGLTASTDLYAIVAGNPSATTVTISPTAPSALPGTTVSGTGTCYFGYNSTVTTGSNNVGLHPNIAGDDALLQSIDSVIQPTMLSPNFQTLQTFTGGLQANVQSGLVPNILNISAQVPNPAVPTNPALVWSTLPGGTGNTSAGFGLIGNNTTSAIEAMIFSRNNTSVDMCDNNVVGATLNNSFRCGFRFVQGTGAGVSGLQMPAEPINTLQIQQPAIAITTGAGPVINTANGLQTLTLTANATATLGGAALQPGAIITLKVSENATGGFTLTLPGSFVGAPPINTAANAVTTMLFQSTDGTTLSYIGGTGQPATISGGTSGQVAIMGSATTVTSSKPIAGAGAGLTSGPTSAPSTDVPVFTGTTGGIVDSGIPISSFALGISTPTGTATFTPGTGVTSVTCTAGFTCTNTRGDVTIVGATAVVGTIATINFSAALSAAPGLCTVTQNGGAVSFGIGHGAASTTSFAITAGVNVGATTVSVDYTCAP
jgi:hypothetical protein